MSLQTHPILSVVTESGVMCCDIHPNFPYLLAIGMYDGNVAVYNLKTSLAEPLYISKGAKHSECVWEVKWGKVMVDGEINFYSVSDDGRVFNWVMMQNKLALTTIMTLFLHQGDEEQLFAGSTELKAGPDGSHMKLKACGTCLVFHPTDNEIFLVGNDNPTIF